jgi:hypothetical protein
MKIIITENQIGLISERFGSRDTFPAFIREMLKSIYKPMGLYGKAPNPNDDCETGEGVIGVFPHSELDEWSILNKFDTNYKVKTKIEQLYKEDNPEKPITDTELRDWIRNNKNELFGPNGKHTKELVGLNLVTIEKGNKTEQYAIEILKRIFPNATIKRFCAGDLRDTRKGIDISINVDGKILHIQVKPFEKVESMISPDGDTYYRVKAYVDTNKYSDRNVDIFMFVSFENSKYILFSNNKNKIAQMRNNYIRFYEQYLDTNIEFTTKLNKPKNKSIETSKVFNKDQDVLKTLYLRKQQIEDLIKKELERLAKLEKKKVRK